MILTNHKALIFDSFYDEHKRIGRRCKYLMEISTFSKQNQRAVYPSDENIL